MEEPIVPAPLVERLREALAKTTTGNWQTSMDDDDNYVVFVDVGPDCACVVVQTDWGEEDDVEFIALAHNAMPKILIALELADLMATTLNPTDQGVADSRDVPSNKLRLLKAYKELG